MEGGELISYIYLTIKLGKNINTDFKQWSEKPKKLK